VIYEGTDGYLVMASYSSGAAFDLDGNKVKSFSGDGDHFGNFLTAVRSRKPSDLNADIEEGHYSSALCHLGNISYLQGEEVAADKADPMISKVKTTDNASDTLERTLAHLKDNGITLNSIMLTMGPQLDFDPMNEKFPDNEEANAMLTRAYRKPFVVPSEKEV
jgi:hypothetical protein